MSLVTSSYDHAASSPGALPDGRRPGLLVPDPADDLLTVDARVEGPHDIVTVSGELDLATAPQLSEAIRTVLLPGRSHLVLDLDQVSFIDSTGLSVLVATHRRVVSEGGSLGLVCNSARCMRVMHMTGLGRLFSFHASVAAATATGSGAADGAN